jgi:hypothetical protein
MKLTATMMLSVDGVYQGPGGPDEDRRGGFERGGWIAPYGHQDVWEFIVSVFERADAFLLGRKTWEIWEPYWPQARGSSSGRPQRLRRFRRRPEAPPVPHAQRQAPP